MTILDLHTHGWPNEGAAPAPCDRPGANVETRSQGPVNGRDGSNGGLQLTYISAWPTAICSWSSS